MKVKIISVIVLLVIVFSACVKDQEDVAFFDYSDQDYARLSGVLNLPREVINYDVQLPGHLSGQKISIDKNKATLGRVLFYDKRLSANETVSCASCHKPEFGFADNVAFSKGFNGELTTRNSIGLASFPSFGEHYGGGSFPVIINGGLFWDGRANTIQDQMKETLRNPIEMGIHDLQALAKKLLQLDYYQILFKKAFPENEFPVVISDEAKMLIAIESFMNSIVAFDSRFDRAISGRSDAILTQEEQVGMKLFQLHCEKCHAVRTNFPNEVMANNGLEMNYKDKGMGERFLNSPDFEGVFKVPMLRNVALTAPYMHDGRFATLEEVVEHYNSGIVNHRNLHELLKSGNQPKRLNLSPAEKKALVAFLHTLTDSKSILQEKYADPFK